MLKDDYETLLRRGMPKHPDIFNAGSYLAHSACEYDGRNGCLSGSDTRDLITMHALRWMESMGDSYGVPFRCANIIDAILAATAHLEPR